MFRYAHSDLGWAGWIFMGLSMLAFWAIIGWAFFGLLRPVGRTAIEMPDQLLARRFAAGEIDAPAYHEAMEVLSSSARHPVRNAEVLHKMHVSPKTGQFLIFDIGGATGSGVRQQGGMLQGSRTVDAPGSPMGAARPTPSCTTTNLTPLNEPRATLVVTPRPATARATDPAGGLGSPRANSSTHAQNGNHQHV